MCGLIAYFGLLNGPPIEKSLFKKMNDHHIHRGPDYGEEVYLNNNKIGLGHRRLSIIDLDKRANQPMCTPDKKHWIVFNGEIYNFLALKKELINLGVQFTTTSDSEVLLWALVTFKEKALEKIEGMFAFVYIDLNEHIGIAARDRVGIKPLCYFINEKTLSFSSTITPFTFLPSFETEIDPIAKFEMLTAKFISAPRSIYKSIYKVLPGEYIKFHLFKGQLSKKQYWTPLTYLQNQSIHNSDFKSEKDYLNFLKNALHTSINKQMVADVPIGTFLSGGIDSSLVTSIMSKISPQKINTYCVGFHEKEYDESKWAEKIANHLGTNHRTFYITPDQVIESLKNISNHYDEPFGDSSSIPTFLLSQLVRKQVKVILSGDGGDEQFFGYKRYSNIAKYYPLSKLIPSSLRKLIYKFTNQPLRSSFLHAMTALFGYDLKENTYPHYLYENLITLTELINGGDRDFFKQTGLYNKNQLGYQYGNKNIINSIMITDLINYLPDDCLTKVDRASMAHSLEVRVPLLDEDVLRVSLKIPLKYKYKNGNNKYILKKLLTEYLPIEYIERPKMGFGVPLNKWLFNELNDFTMDLLSNNNLVSAGFDPVGVQKIINHHKSGKKDHQYFLWPLCAYMSWYINSK
ncbi:MAG: asparagine synthase (glutamine-hydrolyzing) [Spirochaetes bacterium]|nr:asparagine synthase (glutamine-hydrolyzing) [Spirochaetota bacterium]